MHVYAGTFLIAFSTLALEITLTRMLSVVTWYHLAFFAIATAMLGMTAGAILVFLRPAWFSGDRLDRGLALACLGYAIVTPFSLLDLCLTPLAHRSTMMLVALIKVTVACALPFYLSGIVISAALTKYTLPIGRIYASDLIGASMGCLLVLGGLELLDAPSLILLCGAIGCAAAMCFARRSSRLRLASATCLVLLAAAAVLNASTSSGIRPVVVKGYIQDPRDYLVERWNSFSRVVVFKRSEAPPQYWGPSPLAPHDSMPRYVMQIDGQAATTVRPFAERSQIEHLRYDVTNVAYYLRPRGGACVVGLGGGRDVQSALYFGHERVVGIDVNPLFVELLGSLFRDFAGIAGHPGVELVADEARSYLTRQQEQFAVLQMSLIDTWAATGAGAYSLSENALYTTEAWSIFLDRLVDDGIFTVSRWYNPENLGETGRIISMAMAVLFGIGAENPAQHIALITTQKVSTLLLSKSPLTPDEIATLRRTAAELQYDVPVLPGSPPTHPDLRDLMAAGSLAELHRVAASKPLNYDPPTDESPYFFNMLRLRNLGPAFKHGTEVGVVGGNLHATVTLLGLLLSLALVSTATIVAPLLLARRAGTGERWHWSRALYFALIGCGFMLAEIALIQRLSVFLGHPVYALGILLFTIIASTGVGSFCSERLPMTRRGTLALPVIAAAAILAAGIGLPQLTTSLLTASMRIKILASIAALFPMGIVLGFFFPTGMRLARQLDDTATPWYWALNGVFGVLCSALAVFVSIYVGITANFVLSAVCYLGLLGCLATTMRTLRTRA